MAYRKEVSFWDGPRADAPAPPAGFLSGEEDAHAPEVLSFATVRDAFRSDYARRFAAYVAQGGVATPIAAPAMLLPSSGTVFDYGFDFTSGAVANQGGSVADDGDNGHPGQVLGGNGGSYSADLPPPGQVRFATGIGSLDLSTGSLSTDASGATSGQGVVNWSGILANGGLTLETWVKGGGSGGILMSVAGEYLLMATPNGFKFANGFAENSQLAQTTLDRTTWHHVAGVLTNPSLSGSSLVADLKLYVDGQLQATYQGASFGSDLQRGATVGNHPLLNSLGINSPFTGLVYQPRISHGALAPGQLTFTTPVLITISRQPENVTVHAGSSATFDVDATVAGASPADLRFQWRKNLIDIPSATGPSHTTPPLTAGDTSQYQCVVSLANNPTTAVSTPVQATVLPAPQAVFRWGLQQTSGVVAVPLPDISGTNHHAGNLLFSGAPVCSADIPENQRDCASAGSLDFTGTSAALSTANSYHVSSGQGIVTAAQVHAAGGLTMEVWVKNPSGAGGSPYFALNLAGMYGLGVNSSGNIGFFPGNNSANNSWTAAPIPGQWMHLAAVLAEPATDAKSYGSVAFYLNGRLIHEQPHNFTFFLDRAVSVGNHQYDNWGNFEGLVYEPRITLGATAPDQFSFMLAPPKLERTLTGISLSWTLGTLESAESPAGPWTPLPDAVSPFAVGFDAPRRFFRLRY